MGDTRRNIAIIGAGAAGMACADTLAQHPNRFKVTLIEKSSVTGGQATSININEAQFGAQWMNDGVQGGSKIFKHTFNFLEVHRCQYHKVQLQVAFGKGPDYFWSNCFPSPLVNRHASDIWKFGFFLTLIKWTLPILGLLPIHLMLKLMFFSKDFGDKMVYPLIALFLGTGNQTAYVPCAIVERLFDDPNLKLWDYDPKTLLPNLPEMVTFDNLHDFYEKWRQDLVSRGVDIRLQTEVAGIQRQGKDRITIKTRRRIPNQPSACESDGPTSDRDAEIYDDLVMCVAADEALGLLGEKATRVERFVLGGAAYYDDLTVTHFDSDYFSRQYETGSSSGPHRDTGGSIRPRSSRQQDFRPMYYTKSYLTDPRKIEMSFDCSNYQHQLRVATQKGSQKFDHVYQTIFLDKRDEHLWTLHGDLGPGGTPLLDPEKIIDKKWWHQIGHGWKHYLRVVPGMMFINGRRNTHFAGSWTLVNMHEVAVVSGIAAAYRLGASYIKFDDFAEELFAKYLLVAHGTSYRREEARRRK